VQLYFYRHAQLLICNFIFIETFLLMCIVVVIETLYCLGATSSSLAYNVVVQERAY